ncbi:MAG: imidazole glycerol phosphate synthase subunit HisH [Pseudomonadota bacterium]
MSQTIAIIDYGMGNLRSVQKALEYAAPNDQVIVTADPEQINTADRVVFPGQGAARDCMAAIEQHQLIAVILQAAAEKPFLGICMGLQVLLTYSAENQGTSLLNLYPGQVRRFQPTAPELKIPHMGWNQVDIVQDHPLWAGISTGSRFYFVHSYYIQPDNADLISATTEYSLTFAAAIITGALFACQFHPEKSADTGLQLLRNFVSWRPTN